MERLAFWNNPLVVSALRMKFRRGMPVAMTCTYVLLLITVGAAMYRWRVDMAGNGFQWDQIFLATLAGVQFFLAAVLAMGATKTSMQAEVNNRTMDFQRIASVSPWRILLGKLLGEGAYAFLSTIATIPLAVWLVLNGTITPAAAIALYVCLISISLLAGSVGLQVNLDPQATKTSASAQWVGVLVTMPIWLSFSMMFIQATNPIIGFFFSSLIPIFVVRELVDGTPWDAACELFGFTVPYLLVIPVMHLFWAGAFFSAMARRLVHPQYPPYSKPFAYGVVLLLDLILAGLLFDPPPLGSSFPRQILTFFLAHLFFGFWVMVAVTPRGEILHSWIWRFRGQRSWPVDALLGPRSPTTLSLLVLCLTGIAVACGALVVPQIVWRGFPAVRDAASFAFMVGGTTCLILFSLGMLHQWMMLVVPKMNFAVLFIVVILLWVPPYLAGEYYDHNSLRGLSALAVFVDWWGLTSNTNFQGASFGRLPVMYLNLAYGLILCGSWASIRWSLQQKSREVSTKLQSMGVNVAPTE